MTLWARLQRLCCCCCLPSTSATLANVDDEGIEAQELRAGRGSRSLTPEHEQRHGRNGDHVAIDVRPAAAVTAKLQRVLRNSSSTHPAADPSLTSAQLARAQELSRWSSLHLGWRVLPDPAPPANNKKSRASHFFFNAWTGQTLWTAPAGVTRTLANQRSDELIPGSAQWVDACARWMRDTLGIELHVWAAGGRSDQPPIIRGLLGDFDVRGRAPGVWHLLFYAHVLRSEFSLYPPAFLHTVGLRHVVLIDSLSLGNQTRMAVPLASAGALLLDPRIEEITYLTNVLHHELWHLVDVDLVYRAQEADRVRRREVLATKGASTAVAIVPPASGSLIFDDDEEWNESSTSPVPFDFTTPLPASLRGVPLPLHARVASAHLHSVADAGWSAMNPPGFAYGSGGQRARSSHLFLSSSARAGPGTSPVAHSGAGFLNGYSQSAVEEDKAEVFAAIMRNATAMLGEEGEDIAVSAAVPSSSSSSFDLILRAKAHELRRRMEWLCGSIDASFWSLVRNHTPHPDRASLGATRSSAAEVASAWEERLSHEGHSYYFNLATKQTSWLKPSFMHKQHHHNHNHSHHSQEQQLSHKQPTPSDTRAVSNGGVSQRSVALQ